MERLALRAVAPRRATQRTRTRPPLAACSVRSARTGWSQRDQRHHRRKFYAAASLRNTRTARCHTCKASCHALQGRISLQRPTAIGRIRRAATLGWWWSSRGDDPPEFSGRNVGRANDQTRPANSLRRYCAARTGAARPSPPHLDASALDPAALPVDSPPTLGQTYPP